MATILRTIFWNIFFENLRNLIETSLNFVHNDPMNNMLALVELASMSFKSIFFIYDCK